MLPPRLRKDTHNKGQKASQDNPERYHYRVPRPKIGAVGLSISRNLEQPGGVQDDTWIGCSPTLVVRSGCRGHPPPTGEVRICYSKESQDRPGQPGQAVVCSSYKMMTPAKYHGLWKCLEICHSTSHFPPRPLGPQRGALSPKDLPHQQHQKLWSTANSEDTDGRLLEGIIILPLVVHQIWEDRGALGQRGTVTYKFPQLKTNNGKIALPDAAAELIGLGLWEACRHDGNPGNVFIWQQPAVQGGVQACHACRSWTVSLLQAQPCV